jgi:hypothetical protein
VELSWLRSSVALIVLGVLVIAEAIVSHVYRIAWSGDYGWQRILAITLGAGAIVIGGLRLRQTWKGWPSEREIAKFVRGWTPFLVAAVVFEPPPPVAGVPGVTGPGYSPLLWSWFVRIWPEIIPSAVHFYPDVSAVLAWSSALLAVSVAGYFVRPSQARSLTPVAQ